MYLKLETQYAAATALRKMDVLTSFFNLSYAEGDGMISFQSMVEGILKDIKSTGVVLDDSVVIVLVLTSLPKTYLSFLSAWESLIAVDQKLENLMSRMVTEDSSSKS